MRNVQNIQMDPIVKEYVDLHIHTTASDGTVAPELIVERAVEMGLKAIALTDHDAVEGIEPAILSASGKKCEVVPGVELSATVDGVDLHLLGLYIDWEHGSLREQLESFRKVREERAENIVNKLNHLGIPIDMEKVKMIAGEGAIGRPHIAEALLQEGVVTSFNEAFGRYLSHNGPAYVPKFKISPEKGIEMIRSAGGIAVFAHPGTVRRDELIPLFVEQGLQGLEVIHPDHNSSTTQHYLNVVHKHGLVATGGSDFHGPNTNLAALGKYNVPSVWFERLKELHGKNLQ